MIVKSNWNKHYWQTSREEAHDICNLIVNCGINSKYIQAIPAGNDVVIMFGCSDKMYDKVVQCMKKNGIPLI